MQSGSKVSQELPWRFLLGVFAILLVHGATLGVTDDEAYYWVLSQKLDWAYAFHPPAIAWIHAFFQKILGWAVGIDSVLLLRLPAVMMITASLGLAILWIRSVGTNQSLKVSNQDIKRSAWTLVGFAGLTASSWMMVPDLPLIFAWTLAWYCCWQMVQGNSHWSYELGLGFGVCLAILSKYSGVLVAASAWICVLLWAPKKLRATLIIGIASILALVPLLIWNANHDWGSILYQIKERHTGAEIDLKRYLRFWVIELVLAGPVLLFFTLWAGTTGVFNRQNRAIAFGAIWILIHGLVFCLQPLGSDFKAHWAFVVWWPGVLLLGLHTLKLSHQSQSLSGWIKFHQWQGVILALVGMALCHVPLITFWSGDPKKDLGNDMVGWKELKNVFGPGDLIFASRYQTASQAAFALGDPKRVSLVPRDLKQKDEWPSLNAVESQGPEWPKLLGPVYFVADSRYDAGPEFKNARCNRQKRLETFRWNRLAKWVDVWRCVPEPMQHVPN